MTVPSTPAEDALRDEICRWGRSMFERGLTAGSSGNLSARLPDGFLATPTGSCLGFLEPARLSRLDRDGRHLSGDPPTKEFPLHLAFYAARAEAGGVVHLHSTYATALSCLADTDPADALPPITPYAIMQLGKVPVLPYAPPGSAEIAESVASAAAAASAVLLANHGLVVSARTFRAAVFAAEELEETAKLTLITRGLSVRLLTSAAIAALRRRYL
jgi:ribulose-5-phosphate 4-epimerase/fuculose-1-phosphate aldolase